MNMILLIQNRDYFPWVILACFVLAMIAGGLFQLWVASGSSKAVDPEIRTRLAQWTQENDWQMVDGEQRMGPGPFSEYPKRNTIYVRFVARDQFGKEQVGWAKFNHGLFNKGRMDVRLEGK